MKHPVLFHNVRALMGFFGEEQEAFAHRYGVSQGTVSRWGASMPNGRTLSLMAEAAGVTVRDFLEKRLPAITSQVRRVRVVGFVGAGAAVYAFEAFGLNDEQPTIDIPSDIEGNAALTVKGDSLLPDAEEGWSVVYIGGKTTDGEAVEGRLCVVQLEDGRLLVKRVRHGSKRSTYTLLSTNAEPLIDVKLIWAAPVTAIIPR